MDSIWRNSPVAPINFWFHEALTRVVGVACVDRKGRPSDQVIHLAEDGTVILTNAEDARFATRSEFLAAFAMRREYHTAMAQAATNQLCRILHASLAVRFGCTYDAFTHHPPDTLTKANEILLGEKIIHAPIAISWERDSENPYRFPTNKKLLVLTKLTDTGPPAPSPRAVLWVPERAMNPLEATSTEVRLYAQAC